MASRKATFGCVSTANPPCQGKYEEAEPLYRRALEISEKALGPEHPQTTQILKSYSAFLRERGRPEEAEELERRSGARGEGGSS